MKNLIVLLFVLSSCYSFSQNTKKYVPFNDYYENGQLKKEGYYTNNIRTGIWKEYYDTGELKRTYSYTKGKIDLEKKFYFKNGNLMTETIKINGDKFFKEFYETGELLFEKKLGGGYAKEYYQNGNLKSKGLYSDFELIGVWKSFYESGELEWEVNYYDSYTKGSYKQYFKTGKLKVEGVNKKGKPNGQEKRYFNNGKLQWKGSYSKGKLDGEWNGYSVLGEQVINNKYRNGILVKGSNQNLMVTKIPNGSSRVLPVYPGCERVLGFKKQKKCMSNHLSNHVLENFNIKLAERFGLYGKHKIKVDFEIDKEGGIVGIHSNATLPILEKEAYRVIKLIPKIKPGMIRGKPVNVPYSLPIVFMVTRNSVNKDAYDDQFLKKHN